MFERPQRQHPSWILERLLSLFGVAAVLIFSRVGTEDMVSGRVFSLLYWRGFVSQLLRGQWQALFSGAGAVLLLAAVAAFSARAWSRTFFSVADGVLVVEKKTLMKKYAAVPVGHIATVNLESNVLERVLGTARVKLDLSSAAGASASDFVFVLKREKAERLKAHLLRLKAEDGAEGGEERAREPVTAFSPRQIIRHALLNITPAQAGAAAVLLLPLLLDGSRVRPEALPSFLLFTALALCGKAAWEALRLWGFSLERDGERLYLEYGLLHKRSYSFARGRVNAVVVRRPFWARLGGLAFAEVAVMGLGNERNETPVLCLMLREEALAAVLLACAPDFAAAGETLRAPRPSLLSVPLRALPAALAGALLFASPLRAALPLFLLICALSLLWAALNWRARTLRYDTRALHAASGVLNKKTVMLRFGSVQKLELLQNRLFARWGFGRLRLSILASARMNTHSTGYLRRENLEELAERFS